MPRLRSTSFPLLAAHAAACGLALAALLPASTPMPQGSGGPFTVAGRSPDLPDRPDIAYDLSNDTYLVVWRDGQRRFLGRLLRADGTLLNATGVIGRHTTGFFQSPSVANLNSRNAFVVLWSDGTVLQATAVDAATAARRGTVTVTSNLDSRFAVGGEATTADDDAVVVWHENGQIRAAQVQVSSSGTLSVFGTRTLASAPNLVNIRIARSGGPLGRYLIAWSGITSRTPTLGVIVDRNLNVLDPSVSLLSSNESLGGVDGDGTTWVLGHTRPDPANSRLADVYARSVTFDPTNPTATAVGPARPVENDPNDTESSPDVGWLGNSALVPYHDGTSSQSDYYAKSVDPFTCSICEPQLALDSANTDEGFSSPRVATQRSGGGTGNGALVVWARGNSARTSSEIRARAFVAEDGDATDLGGGCGNGGEAFATCARVGHSDFRLRLRGAFFGNAFLFVSPYRIDALCGTCRLVPDPATGVILTVQTNAAGGAERLIPLPSSNALAGVQFFTQWFVFQNGGPCQQLPGHFSNALRVEIQ